MRTLKVSHTEIKDKLEAEKQAKKAHVESAQNHLSGNPTYQDLA